MTFLILFGLERKFPERSARPFSKRVARNLGFWPINIALSLIVILNVTYWASGHALWHRPAGWNGGWLILGDIIILDLFLYFWHRAVHRVDFLWRFHAVHHIDTHLDTTSAIRFHFGEIFFAAFVRAVIIMAFAIPFSSVIVFETLVLMFTLFHHSNLGLPDAVDRILSKVIVTPGIHWVHHHTDVRDRNGNYATVFSLWDPLFRSQSRIKRSRDVELGIAGVKDQPITGLITQPFRKQPRVSSETD